MASNIKIVKERELSEEKLVSAAHDDIINTFNSSKSFKSNHHNDEAYIYREFPSGPLTAKKMLAFVYGCLSSWDKFCYVAALAVITCLTLIVVLMTHIIVFPTLEHSDKNLLISAASLLLCVYVGKIIFESVFDKLIKRACIKVESRVQYATIQRVMSLSSKSINKFLADDLGQIVFIAGSSAKQFLSSVLKSIAVCVVIIALLIQMLLYVPYLFLPTLIVALLFLLFALMFMRKSKNFDKDELLGEVSANSLLYSIIRGIRKIRLYNAERRVYSIMSEIVASKLHASNKTPIFIKYYKEIVRLLELLGLLIIYFCAMLNSVVPGSFFVFLVVYAIIVLSMNTLSDNLNIYGQVVTNFKNLEEFRLAEIEDYANKDKVGSLSGDIQLSRVKFKYGEDLPYVLEDISLKIKPGQFIAIVGKTGCGKSTIARLLMGFEKPTSGTIFYDQKDLQTLDLRSVRNNIGIVQQNGKIISGSIEENILISNPMASKKDLHQAAEIAGIADEIKKMPMGYQTIISDESEVISGGQRQRILIARAVLSNPNILIFDEATSALDNNTQKKVIESLNKLEATKIIIAHRLSTIKNADRVILIDEGRIAEDGSYEQLVAQKGKFYKLIKSQRL